MMQASGLDERAAFRPPRVASQILAADLACLGHEVAAAARAGADLVHLDVMEQESGPSLTIVPVVCAALRRVTGAPLEIHLMVKPVDDFIAAVANAGANVITFHPEATTDVRRSIARVKQHGCEAGLALSPSTPLSVLDGVLDELDEVLFIWAPPGLDGVTCPRSALRRIGAVRERISAGGHDVAVAVEGGVEADSGAELLRAGADMLVVGPTLCRAVDRAGTIAALKRTPRAARSAGGGARAVAHRETSP